MKQRNILIKICGLKDPDNIKDVSGLGPDLMGFILFKGSPRCINLKDVERLAALIPASTMRVGVLVDEPLDNAIQIARSGIFDFLQLHGNETADYCMAISEFTGVIKAFRIVDELPSDLEDYEPYCEMFLFDNAGNKYGGSGEKFDHKLLSEYSSKSGYMLSV
jgi:phosphoribosylanthranilate isomerase